MEINFFGNTTFLFAIGASIISLFGLIYVPFLQTIFQTEALMANDLIMLLCLSSSVLIADEVFKMGYRTFRRLTARHSAIKYSDNTSDKHSEEMKSLIVP